jgi:hypothetical protein
VTKKTELKSSLTINLNLVQKEPSFSPFQAQGAKQLAQKGQMLSDIFPALPSSFPSFYSPLLKFLLLFSSQDPTNYHLFI